MTTDDIGIHARPADAALPAGTVRKLLTELVVFLLNCAEVARQRRQLARLDDRALKDFGINRGDVQREISRSFLDIPRQ